jgi:hypothetical protein
LWRFFENAISLGAEQQKFCERFVQATRIFQWQKLPILTRIAFSDEERKNKNGFRAHLNV